MINCGAAGRRRPETYFDHRGREPGGPGGRGRGQYRRVRQRLHGVRDHRRGGGGTGCAAAARRPPGPGGRSGHGALTRAYWPAHRPGRRSAGPPRAHTLAECRTSTAPCPARACTRPRSTARASCAPSHRRPPRRRRRSSSRASARSTPAPATTAWRTSSAPTPPYRRRATTASRAAPRACPCSRCCCGATCGTSSPSSPATTAASSSARAA